MTGDRGIRILVVGSGSIGQRHIRLCRELLPSSEIMVLHHRSCQHEICPGETCTSLMSEALSFEPSFAIVCSPATFRLRTLLTLITANINLFVEKPLAHNFADAKTIVDAAVAEGIVLQVGYNLRFLESLQYFKDEVQSGAVGRVLSVRCEVGQFLPEWRPGFDWRRSVSANAGLGGGALLELSHEIDYMQWVFGKINFVQALLGQQENFGIDVEDTVSSLIQFKCTTPLNFNGNPPVASLMMDLTRRIPNRSCQVIGEAGNLTWDGIQSRVSLDLISAPPKVMFEGRVDRDEAYRRQFQSFLHCIQYKKEVLVTPDESLEVMAIIEAINLSNSSGGSRVSPGLWIKN